MLKTNCLVRFFLINYPLHYQITVMLVCVENGRYKYFPNVLTLSVWPYHDHLHSFHTPGKKWKKTCCVPSFVLFALTLGCLITGMALLAIFKVG